MSVAFWFSAAVFAVSVGSSIYVWWGLHQLPQLARAEPAIDRPWPSASIVVAALDEAAGIEPALRSLLALDYPALEVIAIDDRSTDATPQILDRIAAEHPRLRVLHIRALPPGWLGKNHALHQGSLLARGEYLLFTDADVVFEPTALKRAIAYCEAHGVDHLTLFPEVPVREALLQAALVNGLIGAFTLYRPWRAPRSPSDAVGVGAFNLVRAEPYRRAGGHAAIAFAVLDDVMLARLLTSRGGKLAVVRGRGVASVEMYRSTREMIRGVEKNAFTFLDYSFLKLLLATLLVLALHWPWVGAFATGGAARLVNVATLAASLALFVRFVRELGYGWRCVLYWPVIGLVMLAIMWRVVLRATFNGHIMWRGTRYSLQEIRRRHREPLTPDRP